MTSENCYDFREPLGLLGPTCAWAVRRFFIFLHKNVNISADNSAIFGDLSTQNSLQYAALYAKVKIKGKEKKGPYFLGDKMKNRKGE